MKPKRVKKQKTARLRNTAPLSSLPRYPLIDLLRGLAISMMIIYHFFYDLVMFRVLWIDLQQELFWVNFRALIVSSFLLLVGFSLVLAMRRGLQLKAFLHRLGWLALCALLVSVGSFLMFAERLIFFGILHLITTASIIAAILNYFLKKHYGLFLPLGLALIALGIWLQHPFFNQSSLQWLGLMTYKPPTEDYVPLLPWLGVVVLGLFAGHICEKRDWLQQQTLPHFTRPLVFAGKHGLLIYMLHQPILIGLLWVLLFAAKNI